MIFKKYYKWTFHLKNFLDYDAKNEHLSSILSYLDETANKDQESFKFKKLNEEKKYDSLYLYEKPESKSLFEKNDTTKMSIKKSTTQQNVNDKVETKKTAKKTVNILLILDLIINMKAY